MSEQDYKEPETIQEPDVQVLAVKEEAPKATKPAKKKKVIQKKFAKYAKGKVNGNRC